MTVKQLVQSGLNAFGLRVSYNKFDLDYFFEAIKTRGFAPRHIVDVGASHGELVTRRNEYFPEAYYTLIEPQAWLQKDAHDILLAAKPNGSAPGQAISRARYLYGPMSTTFAPFLPIRQSMYRSEGGRIIEVPIVTLDEVVARERCPIS